MKASLNGVMHRVRHLLDGPDSASDAELLSRFVAERDGEAFALIVRRHGPMVHGVCRRVLHNAADADDAFQATFLVLARRARAVRPQSLLGNWLHGVAYRTALEARRAAAVRRARERRAAEMKTPAPAADGASPDLRDILDRELAALPDFYRAAIVLCDLEGLSRRDAAERLSWPEGTLSGRLFRARSLLAARLARLGLAIPAAGLGAVATASAAVPPALAESTIRIGVLVAAGEVAAVAAAPVAALSEGVMKAMLLTKLKGLATVVVVSCAVLATTTAGWQANAVGASASVADGQTASPTRRAAQRDADKDRIAELERERDELRKVVRELQARLEKLEANQKGDLRLRQLAERERAAAEAERARLEALTQLRELEKQRKGDVERTKEKPPRNIDGGPPPEIAEQLKMLDKELKALRGDRKAALGDLVEKMKALELDAQKLSKLKDKAALSDLTEKMKALGLDAQQLAKMKELDLSDMHHKMKALELDAQKLAKMKQLAETDLAEKLKAMQLGAETAARLKALQGARPGRSAEEAADRVKVLEERMKSMEADLKKILSELERQRRK